MSKRMTSETIIFDTEWLTEADFDELGSAVSISIDYQAYDTLKIIVSRDVTGFSEGGLFQEFDVYKLENFGPDIQDLLVEYDSNFELYHMKSEGLFLFLIKTYWETYLEGTYSIYIKGVKR